MIDALRLALYRRRVAGRVVELTFAGTPDEIGRELGPAIRLESEAGFRRGWRARTTAAILVARHLAEIARSLPGARRTRIAELIKDETARGLSEVDWLFDMESGSLNQVGIDPFLMRFNYANGILALWVSSERRLDPLAKYLLMAATAWALSDLEEAQAEAEFDRVAAEIRR